MYHICRDITMGDAETFGVEKGYGEQAVQWINEESKKLGLKFEARLYGYEIETKNFGPFEMFSWVGETKVARSLIVKASKRFKIKVIEGSYKAKEVMLKLDKIDYAMVRKGDRVIGHIEFSSSRLTGSKWVVKLEERK